MKARLKDLELELWLRQRNTGEIQWETKDGKKVAIKDMTNSHLINTINMLIRNSTRQQQYEEDCYEALSSIGNIDF